MTLRVLSTFFIFIGMLYAGNPTKSIISLEYSTGDISQTYGDSATVDNRDVTKYGIKLGAVADIKRLFLAYRYESITNPTKDTKGYSFSLEYEGLAAENGSGIFLGLILGYGSYDYLGQDEIVRTQSDIFYGFDAGVTVTFLESYGFDIGMRYTMPLTETKDASIAGQEYKISDTSTSYFSLNYLY